MLLSQGGYRQAMVGSLSRYDAQGQRQYTVYRGTDPEYGKEPFLAHLERALAQGEGARSARHLGGGRGWRS